MFDSSESTVPEANNVVINLLKITPKFYKYIVVLEIRLCY